MARVSNALAQKQIDEKIRRVRAERYACQSVAKLALPKERVSICLRRPVSSEVEVWKHKQTKKAFYSGLMVCGSVWICPVCAAKISERRKTELELAFEQHKKNNGQIALLTLTFAHKKSDKLKDTLKKFSAATQKMMTGRAFHDIRLQMDMLGRIRVFEVTYGANGFHPHVHIALLYKNADVDLEQIKSKMYDLWSKACIKNGLTSNKKYGLDLQSAEHAQEYLSKHGTWSLEQEMSKSHIKIAKNESMTPFDFLREYLKTEDKKYLKLFKEYVECFKGKRQIQWSQGLKKMFDLTDKTDEELALEKTEEADVLGRISYDEWKIILKNDYRSKLLDYVEKYGLDTALAILIEKESSGHEDSQSKEI